METLDLNSGKKTLREFDEVRSSKYKNKYSQKDIESDVTKLNTKSKEYRIRKKIFEAGGKIDYNARSFFSKKYREVNRSAT